MPLENRADASFVSTPERRAVEIIQGTRLVRYMRNRLSFIHKMDCINVSVDRIPARLRVIVRGHTENLYNNRFQFTDSP